MVELSGAQVEQVAGGFSLAQVGSIWSMGSKGVSAYITAIGAVGATLSNYYGESMTIEIVAAGNMCA